MTKCKTCLISLLSSMQILQIVTVDELRSKQLHKSKILIKIFDAESKIKINDRSFYPSITHRYFSFYII